jgi:hypothetical protein
MSSSGNENTNERERKKKRNPKYEKIRLDIFSRRRFTVDVV